MHPFTYSRATDPAAVPGELAENAHAKILGGGTNLLDLMKMGVERPQRLIDITRLPLAKIEELPDGGVRIGALARNSDVAEHPLIVKNYPVLSQALLAGASPQLRNAATTGGNLLQRTRCYYFYDPTFPACNKRVPGSGCGALDGQNRIHAILGASESCIATHPSDMAVAMAALDAVVQVRGPKGERSIPFSDFHRLPGDHPEHDTTLETNELIYAVDLPPPPSVAPEYLKNHSCYLKVRDRASYAFALVSVAVVLDADDDRPTSLRIALGGVAHKPWRAKEAEKIILEGGLNDATFKVAAEATFKDAKGYKYNHFKIELAKRTLVRALIIASSGQNA